MKKESIFMSLMVVAAFAFVVIGTKGDRKNKYQINPEYIIKHIHDKRNP